jgi:NitT/TauT family transport system substrate-binding protein
MLTSDSRIPRLAAAAVALVLSSSIAAAQAPVPPLKEPVKVRMSHVPSFVYGGMYVAAEKGYFKERGLDVDLVIVRGGDTTYQVAGQTIEFSGGSADSAFFNSIKRGLPLITIGSLALTDPSKSSNPLVVRKDLYDAGLTKIEDLKGKRVANLAPGGITEYLLSLALASGGLGPKDVDIVMPMGFAQMAEALGTKAIDAAALAEPFATMTGQRGTAVSLSNRHDLGEQILVIKTTRDYAKERPDVVTNFLIAFLKGARDLAGDGFRKPENLAILEKYTKVPANIIVASATPLIPSDGALNIDSIMRQQKYYMSRGYLTFSDLIAPDAFADTSFLQRANQTLDAAK